jgi:hypothetical protein
VGGADLMGGLFKPLEVCPKLYVCDILSVGMNPGIIALTLCAACFMELVGALSKLVQAVSKGCVFRLPRGVRSCEIKAGGIFEECK